MSIPTQIKSVSDTSMEEAASLLRTGQLVAFPTETVYGIGADARNDLAVARIFEVKSRPQFNPLIVHVIDLKQANSYAVFGDISTQAAEKFWPGPLTLILKKKRKKYYYSFTIKRIKLSRMSYS